VTDRTSVFADPTSVLPSAPDLTVVDER